MPRRLRGPAAPSQLPETLAQLREIAEHQGFYRLTPEHQVVQVDDIDAWARGMAALAAQAGERARHVGEDYLEGGLRVSTVFVGIVAGLDFMLLLHGHKPRIFETIVFDRAKVARQERCSSWDEAVEMHRRNLALAQRLAQRRALKKQTENPR